MNSFYARCTDPRQWPWVSRFWDLTDFGGPFANISVSGILPNAWGMNIVGFADLPNLAVNHTYQGATHGFQIGGAIGTPGIRVAGTVSWGFPLLLGAPATVGAPPAGAIPDAWRFLNQNANAGPRDFIRNAVGKIGDMKRAFGDLVNLPANMRAKILKLAVPVAINEEMREVRAMPFPERAAALAALQFPPTVRAGWATSLGQKVEV